MGSEELRDNSLIKIRVKSMSRLTLVAAPFFYLIFFRVPCFSLNLIVYLNVFMNFGELKS